MFLFTIVYVHWGRGLGDMAVRGINGTGWVVGRMVACSDSLLREEGMYQLVLIVLDRCARATWTRTIWAALCLVSSPLGGPCCERMGAASPAWLLRVPGLGNSVPQRRRLAGTYKNSYCA